MGLGGPSGIYWPAIDKLLFTTHQKREIRMPRAVNGTGTMWYGSALRSADGSIVVTEWVTCFGVPLIPLGSKRILWDTDRDAANKAKPWWRRETGVGYYRAAKVPLHVPHLIKGYAVTIPIALFFIWVG
jgi:hypothetical protein